MTTQVSRSYRLGQSSWAVLIVLALGCGRFGYDRIHDTQTDPSGQGVLRPDADGGARAPTSPEQLACPLGFASCDGNAGNGCETATVADLSACGGCDTRCENEHGTTQCVSGVCAPTCAPGFGDCDGDRSNGCEQSLDDVAHCGACLGACSAAHALAACTNGRCAPTCAGGFGDCDGNPGNGCEADLANHPSHCGGCGNTCDSGQVCRAGSCGASPCATGLGDCDSDPASCESSLDSLAHCGFCQNACSVANGTPACIDAECRVQGCDPGFGDCDGIASNGCEAPLATTTEHCGACAAACTNVNGSTHCSGSSCEPTCSTGFGDCDASRQNGCETALDTVSNCGACGNVCPANGGTPVCNAGVCKTLCDLNGTFALKLSAPCSWSSSQYRRAGSGTLLYWLKAELVHTGNSVSAQVTECGRIKPPLTNTADETVRSSFPDRLYDNDFLPSSSANVTLSASSPGATLSWPLTANLMGISMANPKTDAWPSQASQVAAGSRIDMDRDGKPGMTGTYDGGDYPRTSTSAFFNRADLFYFAARLTFSLSGSLTSCTTASGPATLGDADLRILGCNRANSTQDCTTSESDLLDATTPALSIGAASYTLTRVTNGATCPAIRAALP